MRDIWWKMRVTEKKSFCVISSGRGRITQRIIEGWGSLCSDQASVKKKKKKDAGRSRLLPSKRKVYKVSQRWYWKWRESREVPKWLGGCWLGLRIRCCSRRLEGGVVAKTHRAARVSFSCTNYGAALSAVEATSWWCCFFWGGKGLTGHHASLATDFERWRTRG